MRNLFSKKIGRTDFVNFITAALYIFIYRYIHTEFLVPVWGYFGYYNHTCTLYEIPLTDLIVLFPIFFYSVKKVASNFISIMIYALVYLPTVITIQYYFIDYMAVIGYQLAFMFAMILFFKADKYVNKKKFRRTNVIPIKWWLITGIVLALFVLVYYGPSSLRLVSFADVYDLREENHEVKGNFPLIGYFILWISRVFLLLYMAIGLVYKKKMFILIAISMALLIYMATGAKTTISAPIFAIGIFFCLKHIGFRYLFAFIVMAFLGVRVWYDIAKAMGCEESTIIFPLSALLLMRTLGISGLLGASYIDFFRTAQHTYYSHIGIVNYITGAYPFGKDALGKAVWSGYKGFSIEESMNANANFLVTDGVAAAGIYGVFIIAIIFYYLLKYLNKVSARHDMDFVFIVLLGVISALLNVSLFTTLISCGLFLILIFFRYSTIKYE